MESSVTKVFRKRLRQLPASVQEQAAKAYALWRADPYHRTMRDAEAPDLLGMGRKQRANIKSAKHIIIF